MRQVALGLGSRGRIWAKAHIRFEAFALGSRDLGWVQDAGIVVDEHAGQ